MESGNIAQWLSAIVAVGSFSVAAIVVWRATRKDKAADADRAKDSGVSDGYDKRRVEDIEEELKRSFKYHKEHFDHAKDTVLHPDPRINQAELKLMRQSMDTLFEKLGDHIEHDSDYMKEMKGTLMEFRKEAADRGRETQELMRTLIERLPRVE